MHTKFEATVSYDIPVSSAPLGNPDEIAIDDFDDEKPSVKNPDEIAIGESNRNPDEITLSDEEQDVSFERMAAPKVMAETKFLALDKCLPNRRFLEVNCDCSFRHPLMVMQVIDYPAPISSQPPTIHLDAEWLAITKAFHPFLSTSRTQSVYPDEEEARELVKKASEWVKENVSEIKPVDQVQQFMMTAPEEKDERQKIDYGKTKQREFEF